MKIYKDAGYRMQDARCAIKNEHHASCIAHHAFGLSLLVACCLSLLLGCGYSIRGKSDLPFQSISIGTIINKTYEPKLQDKLHIALTDELIRQGFNVTEGSGQAITGTLNRFEIRTLSEKSGTAVEYEVVVSGDFRLTDQSGKIKKLRGSGAFIVSFTSTGTLQGVVAAKEQATERAMRDLCSEIAASILYE